MEPLEVSVTIRGGFALCSGFGLSGVLDNTIMRDANGLPYIPGTSLKGIVREACEELSMVLGHPCFSKVTDEFSLLLEKKKDLNSHAEYSLITRIFGSPFIPSAFMFHSAYLHRLDSETAAFVKDTAVWNESHNSINPYTGTAKTDHLFTLEVAAGSLDLFKDYKFDFDIVPRKPGEDEKLTSLLICGLLFADRLGAGKTRGKGIIEMDIREPYQGRDKAEWVKQTFPK